MQIATHDWYRELPWQWLFIEYGENGSYWTLDSSIRGLVKQIINNVSLALCTLMVFFFPIITLTTELLTEKYDADSSKAEFAVLG